MRALLKGAILVGAAMTTSSSSAEIIFVEADDQTNTARADGAAAAFFVDGGGTGTDNLWTKLAGQGNGFVWESNGSTNNATNGEDAPRLVTTIDGLLVGELYDVYAYFQANVANPSTDWRLRAGLVNTPEDLPLFSRQGLDGATIATELDALTAPAGVEWELGNGNRRLFQAFLGSVAADANGEIQVYVDDYANPAGVSEHFYRTWYNGVGAALVPEPTSIVSAVIGCVCIVSVRRRKARLRRLP